MSKKKNTCQKLKKKIEILLNTDETRQNQPNQPTKLISNNNNNYRIFSSVSKKS